MLKLSNFRWRVAGGWSSQQSKHLCRNLTCSLLSLKIMALSLLWLRVEKSIAAITPSDPIVIRTGSKACGRSCFVALIPHETQQNTHSFKNPLDLDLDLSSMTKLISLKAYVFTPWEALWSSMTIRFEINLENVSYAMPFLKTHHAHYHN